MRKLSTKPQFYFTGFVMFLLCVLMIGTGVVCPLWIYVIDHSPVADQFYLLDFRIESALLIFLFSGLVCLALLACLEWIRSALLEEESAPFAETGGDKGLRKGELLSKRKKSRNWILLFLLWSILIAWLIIPPLVATQITDSHWVVLNSTRFAQQEVSITVGETIRFANPSSGVPQRLSFSPLIELQQGPGEDRKGAVSSADVVPGQTVHVLFPTADDYHVLGSGSAAMILLVHVSASSPPSAFNLCC